MKKEIHFISSNKKPTFKLQYLKGAHQIDNAHLAIQVLNTIDKKYNMKLQQIKHYISQTFWPGRLQYISNKPDIIFDVAHNESGIQACSKYLNSIYNNYQNRYLILGFETGKEIKSSVKVLIKYFHQITITETKIRNSMNAKSIKFLFSQSTHKKIEIQKTPQKAITNIVSSMQKNDILVILGSHYFGPQINSIFKNCFDKPNK